MACYKMLDMNLICEHLIYHSEVKGLTYMLITKDQINMLKNSLPLKN